MDQGYVLRVDCDEKKEMLGKAVCQNGKWSTEVVCVNSTSELLFFLWFFVVFCFVVVVVCVVFKSFVVFLL